MRICYYTPFKPLDHPNPSGDLIIARGLAAFLAGQGHALLPVSSLRLRWIFWKPHLWPQVLRERQRALRMVLRHKPALWLTYHSYYKAPDLLGPWVCRRTGLPYAIFQGVYATKYRRRVQTLAGFWLNRRALTAARHIFTNKAVDLRNLRRLISENRLTYVPPGIESRHFMFDEQARRQWRATWQVGAAPVVLAAAMFRPDVKTEGLLSLIRVCGALKRQGLEFRLVIAGDGSERDRIEQLGRQMLPGCLHLVGRVPRRRMAGFYSAGDVFAFPGIRESLGMVYLEAQACGLPVVAFDNGGIAEVVQDGQTGFLTPFKNDALYAAALATLLQNRHQRAQMGRTAAAYVRQTHELHHNYRTVATVLDQIAATTSYHN